MVAELIGVIETLVSGYSAIRRCEDTQTKALVVLIGPVLDFFLRQKINERTMEVSPLNICLQILGRQTVKLPQCLDKDLIVWAIRIKLGNFLLDVESSHDNLHEQGLKT